MKNKINMENKTRGQVSQNDKIWCDLEFKIGNDNVVNITRFDYLNSIATIIITLSDSLFLRDRNGKMMTTDIHIPEMVMLYEGKAISIFEMETLKTKKNLVQD